MRHRSCDDSKFHHYNTARGLGRRLAPPPPEAIQRRFDRAAAPARAPARGPPAAPRARARGGRRARARAGPGRRRPRPGRRLELGHEREAGLRGARDADVAERVVDGRHLGHEVQARPARRRRRAGRRRRAPRRRATPRPRAAASRAAAPAAARRRRARRRRATPRRRAPGPAPGRDGAGHEVAPGLGRRLELGHEREAGLRGARARTSPSASSTGETSATRASLRSGLPAGDRRGPAGARSLRGASSTATGDVFRRRRGCPAAAPAAAPRAAAPGRPGGVSERGGHAGMLSSVRDRFCTPSPAGCCLGAACTAEPGSPYQARCSESVRGVVPGPASVGGPTKKTRRRARTHRVLESSLHFIVAQSRRHSLCCRRCCRCRVKSRAGLQTHTYRHA